MNRKQRDKNRSNAKALAAEMRARMLSEHICENCGEKGAHWISTRGISLAALLTGQNDSQGFWKCSKQPFHTSEHFGV